MNTTTEEKFTPPYISFKTVTNLLDRLKDEGMPPQLDRSLLGGSEGYKTQVLAALKVLGFIGPNGELLTTLRDLVNADPEGRREGMKTVIERLYPEPVRLGTINATQHQLEEAFRQYGIGGDTLRKSVAFYLKAAEFAGIPVSQHFRTPKVTAKPGATRPRSKTAGGGAGDGGQRQQEQQQQQQPRPAAAEMTVTVHTAVAGVLMQLPPHGPPWTVERREELKRTFGTVLDFSYPIDDGSPDADLDYEDDEED